MTENHNKYFNNRKYFKCLIIIKKMTIIYA